MNKELISVGDWSQRRKDLAQSGIKQEFWERYVVPSVLLLKGNKCEHCGSKENLDVHHTRYDIQTIETMLVLCRSCHKKWHGEYGTDDELVALYGSDCKYVDYKEFTTNVKEAR